LPFCAFDPALPDIGAQIPCTRRKERFPPLFPPFLLYLARVDFFLSESVYYVAPLLPIRVVNTFRPPPPPFLTDHLASRRGVFSHTRNEKLFRKRRKSPPFFDFFPVHKLFTSGSSPPHEGRKVSSTAIFFLRLFPLYVEELVMWSPPFCPPVGTLSSISSAKKGVEILLPFFFHLPFRRDSNWFVFPRPCLGRERPTVPFSFVPPHEVASVVSPRSARPERIRPGPLFFLLFSGFFPLRRHGRRRFPLFPSLPRGGRAPPSPPCYGTIPPAYEKVMPYAPRVLR